MSYFGVWYPGEDLSNWHSEPRHDPLPVVHLSVSTVLNVALRHHMLVGQHSLFCSAWVLSLYTNYSQRSVILLVSWE